MRGGTGSSHINFWFDSYSERLITKRTKKEEKIPKTIVLEKTNSKKKFNYFKERNKIMQYWWQNKT